MKRRRRRRPPSSFFLLLLELVGGRELVEHVLPGVDAGGVLVAGRRLTAHRPRHHLVVRVDEEDAGLSRAAAPDLVRGHDHAVASGGVDAVAPRLQKVAHVHLEKDK